jgi:hypothetical protein
MEKAIFRTLFLGLIFLSTYALSQGDNDFFTGQVLYQGQENNPMIGVTVYLQNSQGVYIDTTFTANDGNYTFENLTPGNYTVTFYTEEDAGGVALDDANLIMEYLDGEYELSTIQWLAADVNGNGVVNMGDYHKIVNDYLNDTEPFPIGPWVFEPLQVTIPIESREGFTSRGGSSSGDVNGSLQPDPKTNPIFLDRPVIELTKNSSEPIEFDLTSGQNMPITGMHLVFDVPDDLEIIGVESKIIPLENSNIFISGQQIRVTWTDETMQGFEMAENIPLLAIRTKATNPSRDGNSYNIRLADESHLMNVKGEVISGASLILPTINLNVKNGLTSACYPNPFNNDATIEYKILQDGNVSGALYDQSGRLVMELVNSFCTSGIHTIKIDGSFLQPGIYHYSIRIATSNIYIETGTIIKSK